jgi:hypothetical protein
VSDIARMNDVRSLVEDFASKLAVIVERQALEVARELLGRSLSGSDRGKTTAWSGVRRRRKLPRQVCPVPGCTNTAAPVFGMVCSKHKDVPKAQIAKYREARRAKKLKAAA